MLVLALALAARALAGPSGVAAGATVSTTLRLGPTGEWLDFRDTAVFAPWAEATAGAVKARGSASLRLHAAPQVAEIADASDPGRQQPTSWRLTDAWAQLGRGPWSVKAGVQQVRWGVGAGISVVDSFNPYDLEDPTRFDRRLSVPAVKAEVRGGALALEADWAPLFTPAALPAGGVSLTAGAGDLFDEEATGAEDVAINELETRVTLPAPSILESGLGARLRWTPAWADVALSWYHGRDSLPQVDGEVLLTGFQTDTGRVDVGIPLVFPRVDVGGLAIKGELPASIAGWAEAALVLPEATSASASEAQLEALEKLGTIEEVPDPVPVTVTQDGEPYLRWIVGLERFFGPVYVNAQWLHGFPTERQAADLREYGLLALRWGVTPTLRLEASGASDGAGWLASAGARVLAADALELHAGVTHVGGVEGTASSGGLAGFRGVSHGRVGAEMAF